MLLPFIRVTLSIMGILLFVACKAKLNKFRVVQHLFPHTLYHETTIKSETRPILIYIKEGGSYFSLQQNPKSKCSGSQGPYHSSLV